MSTAGIRHVGVVVPVANEELLLERCLLGLEAARREVLDRRRAIADVRIVLVLDSCTDASRDIIAGRPGLEVVEIEAGAVGPARRAGVDHLLSTGDTVPATSHWIANTDADSVVPPGWLVGMLDEAAAGAQMVLGTVCPDAGLTPTVDAAWQLLHPRRDDHPHVHGANLGVRADSYIALGGWPVLATGEDQELADRATAAGMRVVRTGRLPVLTSSRLDGRAGKGFSSYLRDLCSDLADEGAA